MSALSTALVSVAKASNLVGKVLEDGQVGVSDLGTIIAGLGDLSGLASIDFGAVVTEAGTLTEAAKSEAVAAFAKAFDLKADAAEGAIEGAVDAALTILVGVLKGKAALSVLVPKAA